MTFKEKLVKLRKLKGLTQDDFAKAVGVSRQAVYKWESGQSYPEVTKLLEMKVLFEISIDDLLDENYEVIVPEKKKRKRVSKVVDTAPVEVPVQAVEEEPVTVTAAVVEEATSEEDVQAPVVTEPAATEPAAESTAEDISDNSDSEDESKKKVGFFGRLFGRK